MLRLNLGDLLTWQEEEYVVAAARPQTALLRRLADNETVWIDVPILADEIVVTDRVAPPDVGEPTRALEPISDDELEAARWWVPHLNEIAHGVPDPDDPAAAAGHGLGGPVLSLDSQSAGFVLVRASATFRACGGLPRPASMSASSRGLNVSR